MTLRIGWLSPLTPASGVGTFSHAVAESLPGVVGGESIDVTLLHPDHESIYRGRVRTVRIEDTDSFRNVLELFDVLIYNIGNNAEHHDTIFRLLRTHPGIVICHDYVYQHYLADRSMHNGGGFASYAGLLMKFGNEGADGYLARSRITSRLGRIRYSPWDSEASTAHPMSEALFDLGSALVVHSRFAQEHAERRFNGPMLRLGMPHDQRQASSRDTYDDWARAAPIKPTLHMVSFGHIQMTKCIDLVLEALAASKKLRSTLRYTIAGHVGDRDYLKRLEDMVATAGLREIVRFEISVSDARLREIMSDADLFINLRRPNTEASSASLVEQLDTGRPVVVFDSGCFAELASDAALKLPPESDGDDVRVVLERLVAQPARLPVIGAAGRAHARRWSCAAYGERLVGFVQEHRGLLRRRGGLIGASERSRGEIEADDEAWIASLARARGAMRYLDRNVMVLDPALVAGLAPDKLNAYVAHVILGIFDDARLHRALARYFLGRNAHGIYWACAKFLLVAEAVFAGDEGARRRLAILDPCYDVEFWAVIELFPAEACAAAAALMILGRPPTSEEVALAVSTGEDDSLGKRQALLEILSRASENDANMAKLKRWLEQRVEFGPASELPTIEGDFACVVGTGPFREHVDLSGFFAQESDHAWTRGARGFIGLRLGPNVQRVEMLVRAINADPELPAVIALSTGSAVAELEVRDTAPRLLALDVPTHLARSDATTWLQLSTTRPGPPNASPDRRVLGVCLLEVRIVVDDEMAEMTG